MMLQRGMTVEGHGRWDKFDIQLDETDLQRILNAYAEDNKVEGRLSSTLNVLDAFAILEFEAERMLNVEAASRYGQPTASAKESIAKAASAQLSRLQKVFS